VKVVIVGAGSVGSSIARELLAHKHEILLIDLKPEVIGRSGLRGAHWLVGDACELSTLQGARVEDADVVVSATGDDKVNLVVSLLAKTEFGVGRTVGRVNNPKNDWMFNDSWGVDVAVNTPQLMTALVEEAVEIGTWSGSSPSRPGCPHWWSSPFRTIPTSSAAPWARSGGRRIPRWWPSSGTTPLSRRAAMT
jgi:Trk K+ transport system NAD-binding subunit